VLDGEIVALDGEGRPAFYDLMNRQCQPVYYAFDILWLNGRDLRELSLLERKKILRKVIPRKSNSVGCAAMWRKIRFSSSSSSRKAISKAWW
jgi:bifunctional non-homologous end joining protein LigD